MFFVMFYGVSKGGFHVFEVFYGLSLVRGCFLGGVFKVVFRDFEGVLRVFMVVSKDFHVFCCL